MRNIFVTKSCESLRAVFVTSKLGGLELVRLDSVHLETMIRCGRRTTAGMLRVAYVRMKLYTPQMCLVVVYATQDAAFLHFRLATFGRHGRNTSSPAYKTVRLRETYDTAFT